MIYRKLTLPKDASFFLFGPRQTGKTTLLKSIFKEDHCFWYDLLQSEVYRRFSAHPHLFREEVLARDKKITHVVIDEVQRVPDLLNEVHWLLENKNPPHFVLTGSSARKLKRGHANMLGGRALTFNLFPLTTPELADRFVLTKALSTGTLPSVYLESSGSKASDHLRAYVSAYLKEEIELEARMRNVSPFLRFLELAASENGNIVNYSGLARTVGVSYQTIKGYFQILEDTLIGHLLFPYSHSARKRLSKHPKFYFFDAGIVRALTQKLTVPILPHTAEFGRAFEHFMILELMRLADYQRKDYSFSYYRTNSGAEVDFIIQKPDGNIVALEMKAKEYVTAADLRGLRSFHEIQPKAELVCCSLEPRRRVLQNIKILPWREVLYFVE